MFKFYKNKKTHHPSISIRQKDKRKWHNIPISHSKPKNDTFIQIDDPRPKAKQNDKSYIRKYIRIDKHGGDILPPLKEVGASCSMTLASQA